MKRRNSRVLRLIAAFRIAKALLLIAVGFAVLRLMNPDTATRVQQWLGALPMAYEQKFTRRAIALIWRLESGRAELVAAGVWAYAALFLVEGVGLWLRKKWAEYVTIVATVSFLPFEIYEAVEKVTILRIAILLLNVAIVIYLVWRVRHNE